MTADSERLDLYGLGRFSYTKLLAIFFKFDINVNELHEVLLCVM